MRIYTVAATVAAMIAMPVAAQAQRAPGGNAACRGDTAQFCGGIEAGGGRKMRCLADNLAQLSPSCVAVVQGRMDQQGSQLGGPNPARLAQNIAPNTPPAAAAQPTPSAVPPQGPPLVAAIPAAPAAPMSAGKGKRGNRAMANCRIDMATHCADVAAGGGARVQCLRENQAKLTPECTAALSLVEQSRQQSRVENKQTTNTCAADAQRFCADAKGPARRQCLDQNKAQLSPTCSAALDKRGALRAQARASANAAPPVTVPGAVAPPTPPKQ